MIDIVIVNWNAGKLLRECVDSVRQFGSNVISKIVIVDNGSTDESADAVDGLSEVAIMHTGENLGFAKACNLGAAEGSSPYILFLNPDTRIEMNSLSVPLAFMMQPEHTNVGICGIQLVDEQSKVSQTCSRFPTLGRLTASALGLNKLPGLHSIGMQMTSASHNKSKCVDQVMGAFFLIRRELFEVCKGFDERFFVYFEEVDLSLRAKQAGWVSWYLTEAQAFHAGGGTSRQVKAHRLFYSLRSRLLYGFKHFPQWQAWLLLIITGMIEPFTRTAWCLLHFDGAGIRNSWSAYRMLWRGMGQILRGEGRFKP